MHAAGQGSVKVGVSHGVVQIVPHALRSVLQGERNAHEREVLWLAFSPEGETRQDAEEQIADAEAFVLAVENLIAKMG